MIPTAYSPLFLEWLRAQTERAWATVRTPELAEYERARTGGAAWQRGTRWTGGLTDNDIATIEERFGVRFPPRPTIGCSWKCSTRQRRVARAHGS